MHFMPSSHTGHFKTMLIQCATIIIQSIFGPVVCGEQTFKLNKINKRQLGKRVEIFAFVFQQLFKLKKHLWSNRNKNNHTCCYTLVNVLFIFNLFTVKHVAVRANKGANWQEKERQNWYINFFLILTCHHNISLSAASLHSWGNYTRFIYCTNPNWNHNALLPSVIFLNIVLAINFCLLFYKLAAPHPPKSSLPVWHRWWLEDWI